MFTDPMLGAKCVAVDKIVNGTWHEWQDESDKADPFCSPMAVIVGWVIGLARRLWSALKSTGKASLLSTNTPSNRKKYTFRLMNPQGVDGYHRNNRQEKAKTPNNLVKQIAEEDCW